MNHKTQPPFLAYRRPCNVHKPCCGPSTRVNTVPACPTGPTAVRDSNKFDRLFRASNRWLRPTQMSSAILSYY